jgi:hypothetical protein
VPRGSAHSPGAAHPSGDLRFGGNGISYHGGPVMLGTPSAYLIFYGSWSGDSATTIVPNFVSSLGGSPYYAINTTYYDLFSRHVSNAVRYGGLTYDNYSRGKSLGDADVQAIVSSAIASKAFGATPDTNGVYLVLTSADVNETSGFCTYYCAWHTRGTIAGADVKYAFVGDPTRCPAGCIAYNATTSPNGNPGADGMINTLAHEFEESTSDPDLNAWFDHSGNENADKCVWTFGTTYTTSNGAVANMHLGGHDYLVQRNWANARGGYCAQSYP